MIPNSFAYAKPDTIDEALKLLQMKGAHVLAGGHSMLTRLKHRRSDVDVLVDIDQLGLSGIEWSDSQIQIGAMARQSSVMDACRDTPYDLLAKVGDAAGDPAIRARGTVVGAICAIEPGGDWLAAALALDALICVRSAEGETVRPVADFVGAGGLSSGQLATGLIIPSPPSDVQSEYIKVKHAAIGWSIASAALILGEDYARIAVSGAVLRPTRLKCTESAWLASADTLASAIEEDFSQLDFIGDAYASATYRRRRLKTLLLRALGPNKINRGT